MTYDKEQDIERLRRAILSVARKYDLKSVYLFGSRARGDARPDSDTDLLVDIEGADLRGGFAVGGLYNDLEEAVGTELDMVTQSSLEGPYKNNPIDGPKHRRFLKRLEEERVLLYERSL